MEPETGSVITNNVVQDVPERLSMFLDNPQYDYLLDVRFEVGSGSGKEVIRAHEVLLLVTDNCFAKLFQNRPQEKVRVVPFPDLDPAGFRLMIKFVYTNQLQIGNQDVLDPIVFDALRCAKAVGYKAFEEKCVQLISSKLSNTLSNRNCIQLYAKAKTVQLNDPELTQLLIEHIKENVKDVLEAPEFTEISEEELCLFLSCDDWFLDELSVFEAVKRWAMVRMDASAASDENGSCNGRALRNTMGEAFHLIRFPLLSNDQFDRLWEEHEGLLDDNEIVSLVGHINGHGNRRRQPKPFVSRRRGIVAEGQSPEIIEILDDGDDDELERAGKSESRGENNEPDRARGFRPETPPGSSENEEVEESPSKRIKLELMSLSRYVAELQGEETSGIREIDEQLKLTFPTESVYMPKLKMFHLKLVPSKDFTHGAALRKYLKKRFSPLGRYFFFYLRKELVNMWGAVGSTKLAESQFKKNIENIVSQGISVSISVSGATILKICPVTGTLTMHCLSTKDAQMILDTSSSSRNFVLRKLIISECTLTSLEKISVGNLETVLFRRVEGIDNFRKFIRNCPKLKQLICNNLGGESIDLYRDLLRNKPDLEKVYLSVFKMSFSPNDEDEFVGHENLKELYLNRFDFTNGKILQNFPKSFPNLERLTLNVNKSQDAESLFEVLRMPSLNWILVRGFHLKPQKGKATANSEKVRHFLSATFSREFIENLEPKMFVLQRRQGLDLLQENGNDANCAPLRVSQWKGIDLADEDECERYYEAEFGHSSYGEIFEDAENYKWFITTAKNAPKKKFVKT